MVPVSVALIARDEADRIGPALASVAWADEVVVLDSGSCDQTCAIAASSGARVVVEPWRGYGAMKNRAAELCRHDRILSLDADERVDADLAAAIRALPPDAPATAWRVRRRNHVAGRAIRHWPWAWDRQIRLYDRRRARFVAAAVHESVCAEGQVADLPGILDHLTYRDWQDGAERNRRYAELWAAAERGQGRRSRWVDRRIRPAIAFWRHLLIRGHLLSGRDGWRWSQLTAEYVRWKYELLATPAG